MKGKEGERVTKMNQTKLLIRKEQLHHHHHHHHHHRDVHPENEGEESHVT